MPTKPTSMYVEGTSVSTDPTRLVADTKEHIDKHYRGSQYLSNIWQIDDDASNATPHFFKRVLTFELCQCSSNACWALSSSCSVLIFFILSKGKSNFI